MDKDKHEGWTNRATWAVNLYLNDDGDRQRLWLNMAKAAMEAASEDETLGEMVRDGRVPASDVACCTVRDALQTLLQECAPDLYRYAEEHHGCREMARPFGDLLTYAIGQVDCTEIAAHFVQCAADELAAV